MHRIITMLALILIFADACKIEPPASLQYKKSIPYIVKTSALVLRKKPDFNSASICRLFTGEELHVLEFLSREETTGNIDRSWVKVKTSQNKEGYVLNAFIEPVKFINDIPYLDDELSDRYCKTKSENEYCVEIIEKKQLKLYPEFTRSGSTLTLTLRNGKKINFTDNDADSDNCYNYYFREYLPEINYYLLTKKFHEGGASVLVNRTNGENLTIADYTIIPSPDRQNLMILSNEMAYTIATLQIVNIASGSPLIRLDYNAGHFEAPYEATWIDNQHCEINSTKCHEGRCFSHTILVTKTGDKWIVED